MGVEVHIRKVGRKKPRVVKVDNELAGKILINDTYIWSDVCWCSLVVDGETLFTVGHGGGDGSDHSGGDKDD